MRISSRIFATSLAGCCILAAASQLTLAQAPARPAPGTHIAPSKSLDTLLTGMEKEFVDAAEAMPADKFNFAPSVPGGAFDGVRTFAGEVKHIAEANYYFFGGNLSEAEGKAKSDAIEKLTSKDDIIKALKDSFVVAHQYIAGITDENDFVMTKNGTPAGLSAFGIAHLMDHYGQMCIYLRMNGIIPPASRKAA